MTSETTKEEKTKQKPSKQTNEKKKTILSFQIILSSELVSTPACDYMKSTKHTEKQIESLVFFFFLFFFAVQILYTQCPLLVSPFHCCSWEIKLHRLTFQPTLPSHWWLQPCVPLSWLAASNVSMRSNCSSVPVSNSRLWVVSLSIYLVLL